jgi:uncharacterized heparinase superfamily protein
VPPADRADRPLGFLTVERAHQVATLDPAGADRLIARADRILEGFAFLFGHELAISSSEPSVDPLTGYRWPSSHGKKVDYRAAQANPKWIWELNRCQELPILAAAALVSGKSKYATRAASALLTWISTHPPGRGIAWANGFEAGLRAISLALTLDGLDSSSHLTGDQRDLVVGSLWQHARWIERDPSTHSSANNHRIGELVGLLYVAHLAPELDESPRWASEALAELCREATRQVRPDGTGAEQSFAYTLLVLDLLLLATALLDARTITTPAEILDALERAAYALWVQVAPGEPEPDYGDNDDGHAVRLDGEDSRRARQVAAALCARLGNRFARGVAESLDVRSAWMFGAEGRERFERTLPAEPPGSFLLPDGGMAILRSGATRVALDAGPLGYLRIAAHGHADALALTVAAGGRDLIVDPGTGTYSPADAHVRNAFRGTGFHATVVVDGEDQSVSGGAFLWNRHARAWFTKVDLPGGVLVAEHDGYSRLQDPVRHSRAVVLLGSHDILVVDRLESAKTHAASIRWPLHRSLRVELESSGVARALDGDELLLMLSVAASGAGELTVATGEREPFVGWSSPRLEEIVPSPILSWDTTLEGQLAVATLLQLRPTDRPHSGLELRRSGHAVEIKLPDGHGERSVGIDFDADAVVHLGREAVR